MQRLTMILFLVTALINLAPVLGVFSASRLQALYGVALDDPNLVILLRHRAVLFGVVGVALVLAAFHAPARPFATVAGLVSMLSFVVIALLVGEYNEELRRIALIDVLASVVLVAAWLTSRGSVNPPTG